MPTAKPLNLIGRAGAHASDLLLQLAGLGAFTVPGLLFALGWKWLRSESIDAQIIKLIGAATLVLGACTAFSLGPQWRPFGGAVSAGGLIGTLLADYLLTNFNTMGAILATALTIVISLYLVSSFSMAKLAAWLAGPVAMLKRIANRIESWRDIRKQKRLELYRKRAEEARVRRSRKAQQTIDTEVVVVEDNPVATQTTEYSRETTGAGSCAVGRRDPDSHARRSRNPAEVTRSNPKSQSWFPPRPSPIPSL